MAGRALVLGGGGTVGIAWEIGVLSGLRNAGVDLENADLLVGTSAGSVVGTQLALRMPLDVLLAEQLAPFDPQENGQLIYDQRVLQAVFGIYIPQDVTPAVLREIGALALSANTIGEDDYLRRFDRIRQVGWPERRLLVTAVDAESGEFRVWDRAAGVPLEAAVASSCAVPGIFPPVSIDGRRYIDGGMRSDTNAELAAGCDRVLVVTPVTFEAQGVSPNSRRLVREMAQLREGGSRVEVIAPDMESLRVLGPNLMDSQRRVDAANAGVRQGTAAAETARALWGA